MYDGSREYHRLGSIYQVASSFLRELSGFRSYSFGMLLVWAMGTEPATQV